MRQLFEGLGLVREDGHGEQALRASSSGGAEDASVSDSPERTEPGDEGALFREMLSRSRGEATPTEGESSLYDRARRLFSRHEETLRDRASLAEQVIDQLREQVSGVGAGDETRRVPTQEMLKLRGRPGTATGGRFSVVNRDAAPRRTVIEVLPGRPGDLDLRELVRVEPNPIVLEAEADAVVEVEVDLSTRQWAPGDRIEFFLAAETTAEDGAGHRIRVVVDVYDPESVPHV